MTTAEPSEDIDWDLLEDSDTVGIEDLLKKFDKEASVDSRENNGLEELGGLTPGGNASVTTTSVGKKAGRKKKQERASSLLPLCIYVPGTVLLCRLLCHFLYLDEARERTSRR
jgi:hypothetical protein